MNAGGLRKPQGAHGVPYESRSMAFKPAPKNPSEFCVLCALAREIPNRRRLLLTGNTAFADDLIQDRFVDELRSIDRPLDSLRRAGEIDE